MQNYKLQTFKNLLLTMRALMINENRKDIALIVNLDEINYILEKIDMEK